MVSVVGNASKKAVFDHLAERLGGQNGAQAETTSHLSPMAKQG
ncbi:MAG TPA: hypothetical protein VFV70_10025 [Hyphomonadaceae bacterium]|nr:hypothetical protein [Hyphomonadaceae bacterium]